MLLYAPSTPDKFGAVPVNKFTAKPTSHVKSATYDAAKNVLRVRFKSGDTYEYDKVSTQRWNAFRKAPSTGGYLHSKIIPTYEDHRVGR